MIDEEQMPGSDMPEEESSDMDTKEESTEETGGMGEEGGEDNAA